MASHDFTLSDLRDDSSFSRAVGRNQVNLTPSGKPMPLKTSGATDPDPQRSLTSWSVSDILQGTTALKPAGAVYDVFNQSLSSDLSGILNSEGDINSLLGNRQSFAPHDIGTVRNRPAVTDPLNSLAGDSSGGTAGTDPRQAEAPGGKTITIVTVRGITVNQTISAQLEKMLIAATGAGVPLGGSGWRSHQRQIELRTENDCADVWTARPSTCRVPTAIPGTSRHETGLAIDFTENGSTLRRSGKGYNWLLANAIAYGFKNLPSEPWHWSTDGK